MKEQFIKKIAAEYAEYKNNTLDCSNRDIYTRSYEIDMMTNISEILMSMAENLSEVDLAMLSHRTNIVHELYNHWLKKEDGIYAEIEEHIKDEIKRMKRNTEGAYYVPETEVWTWNKYDY